MTKQPAGCHYELFVDGSPGPKKGTGWSGWGNVLMAGDIPIYEACGYTKERVTTNAIELEALIQGLAYLLRQDMPCMVTIWTDSMYVAETMARLPKIGRNDFKDEKGKPLVNEDRIRLLYDMMYNMELIELCIVRKLKGHDGILGNELADQWSKKAAYEGEAFYRNNRTLILEPEETNENDRNE